MPTLNDVINGCADIKLRDSFQRKRERTGSKFAGPQHVFCLRTIDAYVGRCPSLTKHGELCAGSRRKSRQIGEAAIHCGNRSDLLSTDTVISSQSQRTRIVRQPFDIHRGKLAPSREKREVHLCAACECECVTRACLGFVPNAAGSNGVRSAQWQLNECKPS